MNETKTKEKNRSFQNFIGNKGNIGTLCEP